MGESVETSCDARYDKSTITTTTFYLEYEIENSVEVDATGLIKTVINLVAQSTSQGVVRYTYSKTITTTVKAKQIRCPEWQGICFVVDCGE